MNLSFRETEDKFAALLEDYLPHHSINQELFRTEISNLSLYGYGVKGFMLSMIETALAVTKTIRWMLPLLKRSSLMERNCWISPLNCFEGVEEVLHSF